MRKVTLKKCSGLGVALLLVIVIFVFLIPSTSAVKLSPGILNNTSVNAGETIIFQDVNLTIRGAEAIPVNYLTFTIYDKETNHQVAKVRFSIDGTKISENPKNAFTVLNVTDTSNLPYQNHGNYYGYDEETGQNITGFHRGYGYGYGTSDLTILYTINYKTNKPGSYYAVLSVKSPKHTYTSMRTETFNVK